MATRKRKPDAAPTAAKTASKKTKLDDLTGLDDPRAPLDSAQLLRFAQPVLRQLVEDLFARARTSKAVTRALQARHQREVAHERTADPFDVWLRSFVEQVAAAWLLSCVFVRVLEDRGLIDQKRIAGPGALDSQQLFFELYPSLSERDYLLTVFRELSALPAAAALFDTRHNPVWLLAPSAEGARALLALFRVPAPHAPALRFGQDDTRFLGDLYQDLSEDVRKRYALLQTPPFVESFILDRTLESAIERFGLREATLIDPTCGSGHFLLGAFDRLLEHRLRSEPGVDVRRAAHDALDAVAGADINPYAIAIARFRLTLAYLQKAGFTRLKDAPTLPLHLVVADSLLHNPQQKLASEASTEGAQMRIGEQAGLAQHERAAFDGELYALEDEAGAREVLGKRYAAVVGNPPYITVKDSVLRERYRAMYPRSAAGKYAVCAPFTERFFQLARSSGAVGMITANSFMKREFGKKLIEEFLPGVNLEVVINTSGAYIPGHGTPTVLLFGTAETPQRGDVLTVLAKRGEPTTPDDPERGAVWSSIAEHWSEVGFENDYISIANTTRETLAKHPWSLGGGGAAELKALLEERAEKRLGEVCTIGVFGMTNADDCMLMTASQWTRTSVEPRYLRTLAIGEDIRDWSWSTDLTALYPYEWPSRLLHENEAPGLFKYLWPYRTTLWARATFGGGTYKSDGLPWWKWHQVTSSRVEGPAITFAFVATHNHFVLDRGGKVFKQTAPIIKLPETATEDDHLALLAYLNSSTACFWMKQVCFEKGATAEEDKARYEFDGTKLRTLPLPPTSEHSARLSKLARELLAAVEHIGPREYLNVLEDRSLSDTEVPAVWCEVRRQNTTRRARATQLQEEIDWLVYSLWGLAPIELAAPDGQPETPTERTFTCTATPRHAVFSQQRAALTANPELELIETSVHKRRWHSWQDTAGAEAVADLPLQEVATSTYLRSSFEIVVASSSVVVTRDDVLRLTRQAVLRAQEALGDAAVAIATDVLSSDSVPFLAGLRYKASGLDKHAAWEHTWDLQRREDAGEKIENVPVPPKYDQDDFLKPVSWSLRGKLDVPKERFISYPGCESDEDGEPLYGWAGWSHLQQAQALAALYEQRKSEGWNAERLTPMLAGVLELLPWVKQWHNEPSAEFDGQRLGDFFEGYLDGECALHGLSREDLRAWRPAARSAGKKGKARA